MSESLQKGMYGFSSSAYFFDFLPEETLKSEITDSTNSDYLDLSPKEYDKWLNVDLLYEYYRINHIRYSFEKINDQFHNVTSHSLLLLAKTRLSELEKVLFDDRLV